MPQITINLEDPAKTIELLKRAAKYAGSDGWNTQSSQHADLIARQIEEQVKPAIKEPLDFATVVRVNTGAMFVRVGAMERHPWVSGECARSWDELDVVEVLRVGIGDDPGDVAPEETSDYMYGAQDTISAIHGKLQLLRSEAITSERKQAYDVAIRTVEELQP
jgi:hypothetical protein